jgi:hypothetical protein
VVTGGQIDDDSKEVGWHLVALIARLDLTPPEANTVFAALDQWTRTAASRIAAGAKTDSKELIDCLVTLQ